MNSKQHIARAAITVTSTIIIIITFTAIITVIITIALVHRQLHLLQAALLYSSKNLPSSLLSSLKNHKPTMSKQMYHEAVLRIAATKVPTNSLLRAALLTELSLNLEMMPSNVDA